ncbi:MAG: hypothetical protein ACM3NO_02865 [Deltaproteobacteria bacterium]
MTTLINLAAAGLIGLVICFLIVAIVFLSFANDVPRVGGIDPRKSPPASKVRWVLILVLIAALIGLIIHFIF